MRAQRADSVPNAHWASPLAFFLGPKLLRNPFDSVVAYFEALFWRHPSRRSPEHCNRRYRAPQGIDQLPDITPCGRARGNLVEFLGDFLDGSHGA